MKENKKPIDSFLDPKYSLLRSLQDFCNEFNKNAKNDEKQYPIIFTQSFIITGEIVPYTAIQETDNPSLISSKIIFQSSFLKPNIIIKENKNAEYMPKALLLKNVTIMGFNGTNITKLSAFNLFVDQIIGFSHGRIDNQ